MASRKRIKGFGYRIIEIIDLARLHEWQHHNRLRVFFTHGIECANPKCKKKGNKLAIGIDNGGNYHIDLYCENWYPMTVDHIIPKSRGGSDHIDNLQPMCIGCNQRKGNKMPGDIIVPKIKIVERQPKDVVPLFIKPKIINEGATVFKKVGKKKFKRLGKVSEFTYNYHTGLFGVMVEHNKKSIYHRGMLYVKK